MGQTIDMNKPIYHPIKQAVKITGLSEYFFRQSLKNGTLPHIRSGSKVLVNVPLLLAQLDEASRKGDSIS